MHIYRKYGLKARDSVLLTEAELKDLPVADNFHGELFRLTNGNTFYYHSTSALNADGYFVHAPDTGVGRYLLAPGFHFDLVLPITFATADAAILATAPTSFFGMLGRSYWEVTANWTGGTSSAIGLSLDAAPHNTQGDVLGGAGGDVAATLVASAGKTLGTIGADVAGGILLKGGVGIRFDRIVDAFTAGTGNAHIVGQVVLNPGA